MKRSVSKAANYAAFLAAARKVFAKIGFEGATVRDVTRLSGLASGSFYNYFVDKTAIFEAVVADLANPMNDAVAKSRTTARTLDEFLEAPYRAVAITAITRPDDAAVIAKNQTIFRTLFYLGEAKAQIQNLLEADLRAWVDSERMVPHDIEKMAVVMISLGIDLLVQVSIAPATADDRIKFLVELFGRSLRPERK